MNNVSLTGRITKDPEIKITPNNNSVVMFTIAVDRGYKDKDGNKQSDFIPCVAWNSQAQFISNYVKKGNLIEITGTIQSRSYQNQQGETKTIIEVILDSVSNLTPRPKEERPTPQDPSNYNSQEAQQQIIDDEDLPF